MELNGIYAIVDTAATDRPLALLEAMLGAGIRLVQYRSKAGVDRKLLHRLLERTRARGARLIVNDDLDAALAADGWHAGPEDLAMHDVPAVRAALGTRLFGVSCGTPLEARAAQAAGADYAGVGPYAPTASKGDAGVAIGSAGLRAVVRASSLPVVAIGGIGPQNLKDVVASGAAMAAVISAISRAPDPATAAAELVALWDVLTRARE